MVKCLERSLNSESQREAGPCEEGSEQRFLLEPCRLQMKVEGAGEAAAVPCHRSKPIQRVTQQLHIPTRSDLYANQIQHVEAPI